MLKKFTFILLALAFLFPATTLAIGNLNTAKNNLPQAAGAAGYTNTDIGSLSGQIINVALSLVGIIFLALMVYAGYLWMTAKGDESQVEKAQKIITSAMIGLVLTLSAYAITTLVTTKFGSPSGSTQEVAP